MDTTKDKSMDTDTDTKPLEGEIVEVGKLEQDSFVYDDDPPPYVKVLSNGAWLDTNKGRIIRPGSKFNTETAREASLIARRKRIDAIEKGLIKASGGKTYYEAISNMAGSMYREVMSGDKQGVMAFQALMKELAKDVEQKDGTITINTNRMDVRLAQFILDRLEQLK